MGTVFLYGLSIYLGVDKPVSLWIGALAAVLCFALFVCTGMIYACLKFLQEWRKPATCPLTFRRT